MHWLVRRDRPHTPEDKAGACLECPGSIQSDPEMTSSGWGLLPFGLRWKAAVKLGWAWPGWSLVGISTFQSWSMSRDKRQAPCLYPEGDMIFQCRECCLANAHGARRPRSPHCLLPGTQIRAGLAWLLVNNYRKGLDPFQGGCRQKRQLENTSALQSPNPPQTWHNKLPNNPSHHNKHGSANALKT